MNTFDHNGDAIPDESTPHWNTLGPFPDFGRPCACRPLTFRIVRTAQLPSDGLYLVYGCQTCDSEWSDFIEG